jgi:ABC-type antimicrobial peptide transport system permease subunit
MKDWHLKADWKNGFNTGGLIQYVWLFGIIGIFVLILACINFMNLSTAQSENRAKEVGVRKSVGSSKIQLIGQFLSESYLVVIFAFIFAIILVLLLLPSFNQLADKQIAFPFSELLFWGLSFVFILITGILAGSYPAFYLSSFNPVKVLKGAFKVGKSTTLFRKSLVVIQFTVSVILIIGTLIVNEQIQHSKNRPLGYDNNNLIMISKSTEDFEGKYNQLRNELLSKRAIVEMMESSSPLTDVWSSSGGFDWKGKDPEFATNMVNISVSHDFGKTVDWEIVNGRNFSRDYKTDSTAFILNETAVKYMGLKNPVGKIIKWNNQEHEVIGVVKDILMESPFATVKPTVYLINYDNTNWIHLRLTPNNSMAKSLALVEAVFNKHMPNVPFEFQFVDEEFSKKFDAEDRIRKLSGIFAFLAIFISCLGLFGLASFVAEQRTKEIGIRKVLGASVARLWKMLTKDFIFLVLISCLISVPIAYYAMDGWLQNFDYRTTINWRVFALACLGALVITLITVSYQAIKAAMSNPVKSLKTE